MDCRTDYRARAGTASRSLSKGKISSRVHSLEEGPTVTDPPSLNRPSSSAERPKNIMSEPPKNIMSVELAMKRELAYRRKMEQLSLQSPSNSRPALLPSKGASQHRSLVGAKRKLPFRNQQCLPPQQPKPSYTLQPLQKQPIYQLANLTCEICQVPCTSPFNLKEHLKGSKHKAKLKELEEGEKNGNKLLWCELCGVPCMNSDCLQQHLTGKKHLAHLQAIEDVMRMREEAEAGKFQLQNVQWEMIA